MLNERLREYFSFTKKERVGILVLIFLIVAVFIFPYFFDFKKNKSDPHELEEYKTKISELKSIQRVDSSERIESKINDNRDEFRSENIIPKRDLFYFDPNTISEEQWKKLGIREKTIQTIQHFLARGGRFKIPEDLKKVYGLRDDDYNRLLPFVTIKKEYQSERAAFRDNGEEKTTPFATRKKEHIIVDINVADSLDFMSLAGIGSKLASRIIHYRQKLGGFYSIEQIAETYGLSDSVFRAIEPNLTIKNDSIHKIDINTADQDILKQHPYIRWELARAIIQYRNQHGPFKKPEDLMQITLITRDMYMKIYPYIKNN